MSQDIDKDKEAKAERAKTEGNKAFRAKNYDQALELYNIAIELDPEKVKTSPQAKRHKPSLFITSSTILREVFKNPNHGKCP